MQKRGNKLEEVNRSERRVKLPGNARGPVSYRNITVGVLVDTIQTVAIAGGALRFGYTRDGGAFAIGVYGDGEPYTVYCTPSEDVDSVLRSIRDGFDIIGNSAPGGHGNGHA